MVEGSELLFMTTHLRVLGVRQHIVLGICIQYASSILYTVLYSDCICYAALNVTHILDIYYL